MELEKEVGIRRSEALNRRLGNDTHRPVTPEDSYAQVSRPFALTVERGVCNLVQV